MYCVNTALRTMEHVLFPERCLLCGSPLLLNCATPHICLACEASIRSIEGSRCEICSRPLISEEGSCLYCRERTYDFRENYSIFRYSGAIKTLLQQYKFNSCKGLARFFAERVGSVLALRYPGIPVVPVPITPAKRRKRGWGHIELITGLLKWKYGIPVRFLLRKRNSREQKTLDFEHRQANLANKIILGKHSAAVPGECILLDDVFTTGATANECARVLKSAGVREVRVLTLALD